MPQATLGDQDKRLITCGPMSTTSNSDAYGLKNYVANAANALSLKPALKTRYTPGAVDMGQIQARSHKSIS